MPKVEPVGAERSEQNGEQTSGDSVLAALCAACRILRRTAFGAGVRAFMNTGAASPAINMMCRKRLGVDFGIVDLSLAPTPAQGDSVANILEEIGLESVGTHGTTAALAMLNDAVKKGGIMACSHVGGLSGAFIPVSEDAGMIHAAETGCLTIEKLEAMTAVCSVGIDMVIIPGDTTPAVISALIADEAAIGMVNSKTTAVRVIPAIGHKAGDVLDFGGLLGHAPIMPISRYSPAVMIHRGGRIPAPMQGWGSRWARPGRGGASWGGGRVPVCRCCLIGRVIDRLECPAVLRESNESTGVE